MDVNTRSQNSVVIRESYERNKRPNKIEGAITPRQTGAAQSTNVLMPLNEALILFYFGDTDQVIRLGQISV